MGWLKSRFSTSFLALFTSSYPEEAGAQTKLGIEDVRQSMLSLLDGLPATPLRHRIRYAFDVQTLWYLRGDLMFVLAARVGEAAAQEKIVELTTMFQHLLPSGLKSRASPFGPSSRALQNSASQNSAVQNSAG